jgi:hypothetical protein
MARLFTGPLNSNKNIEAFLKSLEDYLYSLNTGARQPVNNDIANSQSFIYFDSTVLDPICNEISCEGCDCVESAWYCVFSVLDDAYKCRQLTIPEAFLIDPNLEGYSTREECEANLCGKKWYCKFSELDQKYKCFEKIAIENQDKIGYNTKEECEANLCATKWYCTFDPDAPIGLDGEDTRWKCEQKQVITADEGQIGYDSKEECESQSLCATKWYCEPDNENGGFKCSEKIVGVATNEVTGDPNAVGYNSEAQCLENCPIPYHSSLIFMDIP